jgi:hypothetical protein
VGLLERQVLTRKIEVLKYDHFQKIRKLDFLEQEHIKNQIQIHHPPLMSRPVLLREVLQ